MDIRIDRIGQSFDGMMAARLGELETAEAYKQIFVNGNEWVDRHLFNRSYNVQRIDLSDEAL